MIDTTVPLLSYFLSESQVFSSFFECYTVVSMGALSVRVLLYVVLCFHVFHVLTELMFY